MQYFSGISDVALTFGVMMSVCFIGILLLIVGLLFNFRKWSRGSTGYGLEPDARAGNIISFFTTYIKQLFSHEGPHHGQNIIVTIVLDIFLLRRTLKADPVRWVMHMLIFYGWMGLFSLSGLMFAAEVAHMAGLHFDLELFRAMLQFPNQLLGYVLLVGIFLAVARRLFVKKVRDNTNSYDSIMLVTLVIVVVTGFIAHAGRFVGPITDVYAGELIIPIINYHLSEMLLFDIPDYVLWTLGGLRFFNDYVMEFALVHSIVAMFAGFAYIPYSKYVHAIATPLTLLVNKGGEH